MFRKNKKIESDTLKPPKKSALKNQAKEVMALILFFLGVFVYLSNNFPNSTGIVGYWSCEYFLKNLVGIAVQYLPLFLIIGSISFFVSYKDRYQPALIGIFSAFIVFVIYMEFRINGPAQTITFPITTDGGGLIGVVGSFVLYKTVGTYGSLIFLLAAALISAVLVFNFSVRGTFNRILDLCKYLLSLIEDNEAYSLEDTYRGFPWRRKLKKLMYLLFFTRKKEKGYDDLDIRSIRTMNSLAPSKKITKKNVDFTDDAPDTIIKPTKYPNAKKIEGENIAIHDFLDSGEVDVMPYQLPPLELLENVKITQTHTKQKILEVEEKAKVLEATLASFNVQAKVVNISPGPSVTRYELQPGEGVKISKITGLSQDIALKLAAPDVRIEAPIPGKALIGIEIPNPSVDAVNVKSIIQKTDFMEKPSKLTCAVGLTITGEPIVMALEKMPHLLIAGATGSGKSVCVNGIILSILLRARPDEVKFLMIDPKKVELSFYNDIPHLLAPVVTNPHLAAATLKQWALAEMERRYEEFAKIGVKDIAGYNTYIESFKKKHPKKEPVSEKTVSSRVDDFVVSEKDESQEEAFTPPKLPYIVVIIDELADLMMVASQEVENTICRLAQMARATGIHLVIATQRPSVNVVTGLIKANVPSRIAFYVQSQIDSRTILDMGGAEKLIGKGDMLYMPAGSLKPKRVQGVFVSEKEVRNIVNFVKKQAKPTYVSEILEVTPIEENSSSTNGDGNDDLFDQAKEIVQSTRYASTSYLQRKLRIGYNRAARLMDELEEQGIISAYDGEKKARVVL